MSADPPRIDHAPADAAARVLLRGEWTAAWLSTRPVWRATQAALGGVAAGGSWDLRQLAALDPLGALVLWHHWGRRWPAELLSSDEQRALLERVAAGAAPAPPAEARAGWSEGVEALGLRVLDENGKLVTVTMGSYGIGVTRILAILAELHHDDRGLIWPESVAPFDVHLVATGKDEAVYEIASELASRLADAGLEVLFDDRPKVSPGVKFGDAELLGMPRVVVVGRDAADGFAEVWDRAAGTKDRVAIAEVPGLFGV